MSRSSRGLAAALVAAASAAGCARVRPLAPVDSSQMVAPGVPAATSRTHGVRVTARFAAWGGDPDRLEDVLVPVLVKVENDGKRRVRLRYNEIRLDGGSGAVYHALPPFALKGSVRQEVTAGTFAGSGFAVAPYLRSTYPFLPSFGGRFAYDPFYYDTWYPAYPVFAARRLPTWDMVSRALPEGVVHPEGRVTGFVYFAEPEPPETSVTFVLEVVDADTETPVGTVSLPFSRESGGVRPG